jgi:hypothetical protein
MGKPLEQSGGFFAQSSIVLGFPVSPFATRITILCAKHTIHLQKSLMTACAGLDAIDSRLGKASL